MDYGAVACFHQDSYSVRRGGVRQGSSSDYRRSGSSPRTQVSPRPATSSRLRGPLLNKSTQVANMTTEEDQTSFGDIFTAVLGSKLARQPSRKFPRIEKYPEIVDTLPPKPSRTASGVGKKVQPAGQSILEPLILVSRVREDRERQLDTRCVRIIRKLSHYPEYQSIVRRLAAWENEGEPQGEAMVTSLDDPRVHLRSSCGVRAYLLKFLKSCEPKNAGQGQLHISEDSTPEHSFIRETNGSPNRYERMSRSSMTYDQLSEMEESFTLERSTKSSSSTGNIPPETLLRRLARSISTRLDYKHGLHSQTTARLSNLDKETDVIRSVLQKVVDEALPQMRNEADVCYLHIPPNAPPATIEMKVCVPPTGLSSSPVVLGVTSNLVSRFDRLLSSQVTVLELLCQLSRRLCSLDRRINECIISSQEQARDGVFDGTGDCDIDAKLFPLRSRREQLLEQIGEAQGLRSDFDTTKVRLLSGLQQQFFVLRDTEPTSETGRSTENSTSLSEGATEGSDSSCQSSPTPTQRSQGNSVVSLAEFISRHLDTYLQTLFIKLSLETEILEDQEAVDCVGEHLRLVASFSP